MVVLFRCNKWNQCDKDKFHNSYAGVTKCPHARAHKHSAKCISECWGYSKRKVKCEEMDLTGYRCNNVMSCKKARFCSHANMHFHFDGCDEGCGGSDGSIKGSICTNGPLGWDK